MSQPAQAAPGTAGARTLGLDLALYVGFAVFALVTALLSEFATHRIWGCYAAAGYGLAAAHTTWRLLRHGRSARWWRSRWAAIAVSSVLALLAPLVHLVLRRSGGGDWHPDPVAWGAQPEVWVIERSASLLLRTGTPYVDVTALGRPPAVNDYTPYGPVMAVFGLPRALIETAGLDTSSIAMALTDARLVFAAVAVGCVLTSLRLLGRPRVPIAAAQLAVVSPATALTWAVAGPDLAVLGLLVLALVFAVRGNAAVAGLSLALVISAKLTAAPAILVLLVLLLTNRGTRAAMVFTGALVATTAAVHLPVILLDPRAFLEHVIAFPAGAGVVESPAASPLPGHLIADTGPAGHTIALVLLALAAIIIAAWIVLRPPATGSDAALRIAVGLGAATLLTPATRWGYLVYPLAMLGARLCLPDLASTPNVPDTPTARSTNVTRAGE